MTDLERYSAMQSIIDNTDVSQDDQGQDGSEIYDWNADRLWNLSSQQEPLRVDLIDDFLKETLL